MILDKVYCINLVEDTARKEHMIKEFAKVNLLDNVIWMSANRPPKTYKASNYQFSGEFGCALSHLKALVDAIGSSNPIAVFEDDAVFCENAEERIYEVLYNLPPDWSIVRLGGRPQQKLIRYNDYLCIIGKFIQTTGYIVNPIYLKDIVKFMTDRISLNFPNACADNMINDYTLLNSIPGYTCYPPIVHQKDGYSTLRFGDRNYKSLTDSDWVTHRPC